MSDGIMRGMAVIWHETEAWGKADPERDKEFVADQKLTEGADEVFVDGDSFIPDARALEPAFKARMLAVVDFNAESKREIVRVRNNENIMTILEAQV
jgi:hypothetical protein